MTPSHNANPSPVHWLVQTNMLNKADADAIRRACHHHGHHFHALSVRPFCDDVEAPTTQGPVIFYGSARLTMVLTEREDWIPGVFFDAERFRNSVNLDHYGQAMLNHDATTLPLGEVPAWGHGQGLADVERLFIRPDDDGKSFAGQVMTFGELCAWVERLSRTETTLSTDAVVLVAPPKAIEHEWRLFIVDAQVVTASHYRALGRSQTFTGAPPQVRRFAEDLAMGWSPARAFVMDVAHSGGALKVLEINGINSSGFYEADVDGIVASLSALAQEIWRASGE